MQRITQTLGHELSLKSRLGHGSRFRVTLPVVGTAAESPSPSLSKLSDLNGVSVLILENDPAIAEAMQRLFEQWECKTFVAYGLSDVDKHLKSSDRLPDIIVADYHLDGNDVGVTAIEAVRAILPEIPALVITADQSPETAEAVRAAGAMLLEKPVSPGRLRASVSHLLSEESRGCPVPEVSPQK